MTALGNNLTFEEVVTAYAPPVDLSTVVEKPDDFADNDLASYIELKSPTGGGYELVNEFIELKSQYAPDQERNFESYLFNGTYTAVEIIQQFQVVITDFMREVFTQNGFSIITEVFQFNFDRFFTLKVEGFQNLQFLIQNSIMQLTNYKGYLWIVSLLSVDGFLK